MQTQKINEISIIIDKAKITAIDFNLENERPDITMKVELLSTTGKLVTSVTVSTRMYYGLSLENDYVPPEVYHFIGKIVNLMSPLCVRRINQIDKLLGSDEAKESA